MFKINCVYSVNVYIFICVVNSTCKKKIELHLLFDVANSLTEKAGVVLVVDTWSQ